MINANSSRTETVGTLTTQTSANGSTRVTSSNLDGSGSIDCVWTAATIVNSDGPGRLRSADDLAAEEGPS